VPVTNKSVDANAPDYLLATIATPFNLLVRNLHKATKRFRSRPDGDQYSLELKTDLVLDR
jgi:hypothetical protein